MPYPILTLPYPFAKRLRQLLDPFELEKLQNASGPYIRNELKPIVKSSKIEMASICPKNRNDYKLMWFYTLNVKIPEVTQLLIHCTYDLSLNGLTNSNFQKRTTPQLLIKVDGINFLSCHISNAMLTNVSKIAIRPCRLYFMSSNDIDEDVTFSTIVNIFPYVNCIAIQKVYCGWLDDLISTKQRFESIEISHDNFDELFSFKPADLYDYFMAQRPPFYFRLTYKVNASRYAWIIHMIQKFIDPRFDKLENVFPRHNIPKVVFRVQLLQSESTYKDFLYYCKNRNAIYETNTNNA